MKIRAIVVLALIIGGILSAVVFVKADRPIPEKDLVTQAMQDKNTPLLIRSLITRMKNQVEKDADQFPELIREVEKYAAQCTDSTGVAVLHSMIAQMYRTFYMNNQWRIDGRTELVGYVPDNIREWTANLFTGKIREQLALSLQPPSLLQHTPVSRFGVLLEKGDNSSALRPTLYDFLVYRAIEIQPATEWYRDLLAFRRTQPDKKALLLADLDYLQFEYNPPFAHRAAYEAALDSLYRLYGNEPYGAEIQLARFNLLETEKYQAGPAGQDSVQTLLYDLCKESIARYPDYERINDLKNRLAQMENPSLNVQNERNVYPGKDLKLQIKYVNIPELSVKIYKSLRNPLRGWNNYYDNKKPRRGELVKEQRFKLPLRNSYTSEDTTLAIPMEKPGLYEYVVSVPEAKEPSVNAEFSVSRLAALTRSVNKATEVLVTDFESGKPLEGATVTYFQRGKNNDFITLGQKKTDSFGLVSLPDNAKIDLIRPVFKEDTFSVATPVFPYGTYRAPDGNEPDVSLFTDRGIYRPGQTIFFKGIAYVKDTDDPHIVAGKSYSVILRDANYQEVATKKFTTDGFGSFNGEFTIPEQVLSGNFTITAGNAQATVRVEEYKRPTFKVEIDPVTQEVVFGKPVVIKGNAQTFSGVRLQTGEVKWQINRRPFWRRYYMPNPFDFSNTQVTSGTVRVDDRGAFSFSFVPERMQSNGTRPVFQSYEVVATLTDSKGETQEARYNFSVGDRGIILSIDAEPRMERDSAKIEISAFTANARKTDAQGTYILYALDGKEKEKDLYGAERYKTGKEMASGSFTTKAPLSAEIFRELPSGRYRIVAKAADAAGKTVTADQDFILYGRNDKRPPVFEHTWLIPEKITCLPGEEARFVFGTSDKHTHILYEIYNADQKCLKRTYIELNDENRSFRIPFKEEDGEGFIVTFTFVKEGEMYTAEVPVYRKEPDRLLTIRPETFRDHLLPGSKENWKFRITGADSAAVTAQVLAGMYDASLDKIYPFRWRFTPVWSIYLNAPHFSKGSGFTTSYEYGAKELKYLNVPAYQYDRLDWQGVLSQSRRLYNAAMPAGAAMKSAALSIVEDAVEVVAEDKESGQPFRSRMEVLGQGVADLLTETEAASSVAPVQLRENFAETAFFYPVLVTDAQGEVAFSFTIPESNTTWKLQLVAQTKDLKYGYMSKEVVTSKPLMVLPNLPRFLRQGDEVTISSQISNLSESSLAGRARFELFDPTNDQPVVCLTKSQKPFTLAPDSTTTVSWSFTVPTSVNGLVGCRIIADSDQGSDGEQHLIPVLSNQILITESTPFYLFDKKEESIQLRTGKGIRPFRTTLELTANPIWYAVQALPTLTQPANDDIISWFASYYSTTLAASIAASHPKIKQVISQWKAQGGTASTLYSNLEKNRELKNILLQETPWVLAADNETEQKQRLSLLFDLNRTDGQRQAALQQLLARQTPEGGWSWFKNMRPSRQITLFILKGMSQLTEMNAVEYNQQEKEMQMKALNFLDKTIAEDYQQLQKNDKNRQKVVPTPLQLDYLFVRSGYRDIPELGDAREAIRFYTGRAEATWNDQSLYGKGETAWLMFRNGKKETADQILAWFRKTATVSETLGMYWANNRYGESFFISPIDTHCLLMSLFNRLSPDTKETDRMKQWLLSRKQTQSWESVPATTQAIYALLLTGSDWLDTDNTCTVRWGDRTFSTATGETATGYLKVVLPADKQPAAPIHFLSVEKTGSAPAWGAVYEQFFENINKVKKATGTLDVEKKLFAATYSGTERRLQPVTAERPLRIGDQVVVRLTIRTDRPMEYVFLKDLRAGCFEPASQLSGSQFRDGVWYYQSPTDVSENFFFDSLPQGTFVLEYTMYVARTGVYAGGISTIQCLYAPEFVAHTEGNEVKVD